MNGQYILVDRRPVQCDDTMEWSKMAFNEDLRRVGQDKVSGRVVSTVFLGIDHRHGGEGPPILFETMIFDENESEVFCTRYCTWAEAEAGHKAACRMAMGGKVAIENGTEGVDGMDDLMENLVFDRMVDHMMGDGAV